MTTFTVTTTWGSKHWDVYGRRCVESILAHWPKEVKKIFYPDDTAQSINDANTQYFTLGDTQPQLQKFIDRNKDNNFIKQKMAKPLRSAFEYDAVRFSWKVFCMIDAASRCDTDRLIFVVLVLICWLCDNPNHPIALLRSKILLMKFYRLWDVKFFLCRFRNTNT